MARKTIEDILVDKNYKKVEKKKNNTFIIIFLVILIITIVCLGVYFWKYLSKSKEVTAKDLFLQYVTSNNLDRVIKNDLYKDSYKKLVKDSFSMDTVLEFSTTSNIDGIEGTEISKFSIDNKLIKRSSDNRIFTNSIIKHLENEIFDLKTISQGENFAMSSGKIVTKYISGNANQMNNLVKQVSGYDLNLNFGTSIVNEISNSQEIELSEKNITTINNNLVKLLEKNIDVEKVTQKEIIVDSNGNQVLTTEYSAIINKRQVLDVIKNLSKELKENKFKDKLITGNKSSSIFDIESIRNYDVNSDVDLENVIDSSEFIVGAEADNDGDVAENIIEERPVSGTITSTDVEHENLEHREGVIDETVIGYQPPVQNNTNNNNNNQSNNSENDTSGTVINIVNPNLNNNNSSNNNQNNNNVTNNTVINTVTNTVSNTVNNTVNNQTDNKVTNTANGGSNISSDIVVDDERGGTVIPIGFIESVEINSRNAMIREFATDIQIIQNPNLTTEEDKRAQEENKELLKEETEELFSSITDAIENNAQIVDENMVSNFGSDEDRFYYELEIIKSLLFKTKMNITDEKYEEMINNFYEYVDNYDFENIIVNIYVENNKTIKMIITDNNKLQIEIDFIDINDAESKVKFLYLKDKESRTGKLTEIYKSQREASCSYEITFSTINEGKIVEKLITLLSTKGTSLGNNLDNNISIQYLKGNEESFSIKVGNRIVFSVDHIEELSNQNCLFLNSLSNEEYVAIVNAVKRKTMDVLSNEIVELNLLDVNTSNEFLKRIQNEARRKQEEAENISKDDARNLIIDKVSILMGEKESQGEEINLNILNGFTIDGYDVTSVVTENEVLIVLNGYEFIINQDFIIIDKN